jgi:XTP/dITP diphosphohydrolase
MVAAGAARRQPFFRFYLLVEHLVMKLLIATHNAGKVRELADALRGLDVEIVRLTDLGPDAPDAPEETGSTFEENALLKARYFHERTGLASVADDSGLEVAALGGRPGVLSARYAGPSASDAERVERLLAELRAGPASDRSARFVCVLALAGDGFEHSFAGACEGRIAERPSGRNGFGYDPVFVPVGETRTFAEMSRGEKAAMSHRGRAVRAFEQFVRTTGIGAG